MFDAVGKVDFEDMTEVLPAFITILMMPLTYSIAEGIVLGMLSYTFLKVLSGRYRDLNPVMYVLSLLFILKYIFV